MPPLSLSIPVTNPATTCAPHARPVATATGRSGRASALAIALALAGCSVGPDYVRPDAPMSAGYKEAVATDAAAPGWKPAQPGVAQDADAWWNAYADPTLADLLDQAARANQSVAQADANVRAARATVDVARSGFFPTVTGQGGFQRSRTRGTNANSVASENNVGTLGLGASWEPDLWGLVRRSVEAARASADAVQATAAGVRLTVAAEVAQDYFSLRIDDQLIELYARTVDAYQRALKLTQSQFRAGIVSRTDVALATSQLENAVAQLRDISASRATYEHAIANLVGKPPSAFSIAAATFDDRLPIAPTDVPSTLLERRPDIANAERLAAAANAQIGVQKAAYYPALLLSATGGFAGATFGTFFDAPGRVWSLGAALSQIIFDGGLRAAQTARAYANYDAAVAGYRQTVLNGFQEVEDNLALLRILADEQVHQDAAVAAAADAERIALAQYRAGTTTFLTVITAQSTSLSSARLASELRGRRYVASVSLIRALGGGWSTDQLDSLGAASTANRAVAVNDVVEGASR